MLMGHAFQGMSSMRCKAHLLLSTDQSIQFLMMLRLCKSKNDSLLISSKKRDTFFLPLNQSWLSRGMRRTASCADINAPSTPFSCIALTMRLQISICIGVCAAISMPRWESMTL